MNERESSCPHCSERIAESAALCRHCQRGIDPQLFKACPLCKEMIRNEATYCRFCSNKLVDTGLAPTIPPPPAPPSPPSAAQDNASRDSGISKFYLPRIGKLFKPTKDNTPLPNIPPKPPLEEYSPGVRAQVLEVIVRQALAGAPWREICAGPMLFNNITPQEVEAEVRRRMADANDAEPSDMNVLDHNSLKCEKLIKRLLRIADDLTTSHSQSQRNSMAEDIRELVRQLSNSIEAIREHADNNALTNAILQNEVDMYGTKYDAILDLLNARDKIISKLEGKLRSLESEQEDD